MSPAAILFLCLSSTFIGLVHGACQEPDCTFLDYFAIVKMDNYSTWLQASNNDPSPLLDGPTDLRAENAFLNLSFSLSNHGVRGHSNGITIKDINTAFGITLNFTVLVDLDIVGNVTVFGDYVANGVINTPNNTQILIDGQGTWYINFSTAHLQSFVIAFTVHNLPELLRFTGFDPRDIWFVGGNNNIYFENLFENEGTEEYKDLVETSLYIEVVKYIMASTDHPLKSLYKQYWQKVIEETGAIELFGYTLPPSSTTEIAPPAVV